DAVSDAERQPHVDALRTLHRQLANWAETCCPENFQSRARLVGAKLARLEDRELEAERLYEQAIRAAHENGFVHNEALANELGARFHAARGFDSIADGYRRSARYAYLRWGATAKVRQLEEQYPHLRDDTPIDPTRTVQTSVERLDLATVLTVSQAV